MLNSIIVSYRSTGKTTRMLQEAIQAAKSGLSVVIVANDEKHRGQLRMAIRDLIPYTFIPDPRLCIMLIKDCHISHERFDVHIRGGKKPDIILFDHYTLETTFRRLLNATFEYYGDVKNEINTGEGLRWKKDGMEYACPKCGFHSITFSYCPHCGQRLFRPIPEEN